MNKLQPLRSICCTTYPQNQKVNARLLVVVESYVYDGEDGAVIIGAAFDEEEAQRIFKERIEYVKENDHLADCDDVVVEEDEVSFSMYSEGEYSEDHIHIEIHGTTMDVCDAVELKKIEFCEQMIAERIDKLGYHETINDLCERGWDRGDLLQYGFSEDEVDEVLTDRIKKEMKGSDEQ